MLRTDITPPFPCPRNAYSSLSPLRSRSHRLSEFVVAGDLADGENVAVGGADRLQDMDGRALAGVAGSDHLDDPFAGFQFQRLAFEGRRRSGRQVLLGVAERVAESDQGGLQGRLYELGLRQAGIAEEVATEVAGRNPYRNVIGGHQLAAGDDLLTGLNAQESRHVVAGGFETDVQHA